LKIDSTTGVVSFLNTKDIIDLWQVYAVAKTRAIESNSDYPVLSYSVLEAPKFAPAFYRKPGRININVAEFLDGSRTSYVYQIPAYYDQNPFDTV